MGLFDRFKDFGDREMVKLTPCVSVLAYSNYNQQVI